MQGPTGRQNHSVAVTKEDFFASILNSAPKAVRDSSRPRRQSRVSREIVSSSEFSSSAIPGHNCLRSLISDNSMLVNPTLEWQDRLSSRYATIDRAGSEGLYANSSQHSIQFTSSFALFPTSATPVNGGPPSQRRRLDLNGLAHPDWDRMYTLDRVSGNSVEPSPIPGASADVLI